MLLLIQSSEPLDRKLRTLYNVFVSDTSTIIERMNDVLLQE